jgi:hypothetical protein
MSSGGRLVDFAAARSPVTDTASPRPSSRRADHFSNDMDIAPRNIHSLRLITMPPGLTPSSNGCGSALLGESRTPRLCGHISATCDLVEPAKNWTSRRITNLLDTLRDRADFAFALSLFPGRGRAYFVDSLAEGLNP